jgi:hypothetical protein
LKIIINDLKETKEELFKDHLNSVSDVLNKLSNPTHKDILLDQLTVMETKFKNAQTSKRDKKLKFLFQKSNLTKSIKTSNNNDKPEKKRKNIGDSLKEIIGKKSKIRKNSLLSLQSTITRKSNSLKQ